MKNYFHLLQLTALLVFCTSLTSGMPSPVPASLKYRILSAVTGRYLSITKSGRINANGAEDVPSDRDPTPLIIYRLDMENQLRIESVKFFERSWFILVTQDGKIRGDRPSGNGEDVLEEVVIDSSAVALRVVNYSAIVNTSEGSGLASGEEPPVECYIGFSDENGRAKCYDDINNVNVRLTIIPHDIR